MGNVNTGWRVLDIFPNGPAAELDITVFFDFIVGVDGHRLDMSRPNHFFRLIEDAIGREVNITLYNYKTGTTKWVTIVPSHDWGGEGLLGLQLSNDSFELKDEHVIKVKKVTPNSAASQAGFLVEDFIIASGTRKVSDIDVFKIMIRQFAGQQVSFWVYRADACQIRQVTMNMPFAPPIGLEVSDGVVNQIPPPEKTITMFGRETVMPAQTEPPKQTVAVEPQHIQATSEMMNTGSPQPAYQPPPTSNSSVSEDYEIIDRNVNTYSTQNTAPRQPVPVAPQYRHEPVPVAQYAMPRAGGPVPATRPAYN